MRSDPPVVRRMAALSPGDCAISTVTSYELYTGVEKCSDPVRERAKIAVLVRALHVLPWDEAAARGGTHQGHAESQGRMIGPYDVLLAGHAVATGLGMVKACCFRPGSRFPIFRRFAPAGLAPAERGIDH